MTHEDLAAYYTPQPVADFLVAKIPLKNPKSVLDLCVGSGNLLAAARGKWPSALLVGMDINPNAVANCKDRFTKHAVVFQGDARLLQSGYTYNKCFELNTESFDVVLANPPFIRNGKNESPAPIPLKYDSSHLIVNWASLSRHVEAQLLVYNMLYVRYGGYLAAILPNSIFSCDRFVSLRNWLIAQSDRIAVIKLPENIFNKSEVLASVLIIKRKFKAQPPDSVNFTYIEAKSNFDTFVLKTIYKGKVNNANNRLDLVHQSSGKTKSFRRLNEFVSTIRRGTFIPKSNLETVGLCHYIHSTNIKDFGLDLHNKSTCVSDKKALNFGVYVQQGDILIVRVGKTLGRIGLVTESDFTGLISSCLFLVRPNGIDPYALTLLLQYAKSQNYYKTVARGSAAKFLTYADIEEIPIPHIAPKFLIELTEEYKAALSIPIDSAVNKRRQVGKIRRVISKLNNILKD